MMHLSKMRRLFELATIYCCLQFLPIACATADKPTHQFSVTQEDDGVTVNIDGELFTRYLTNSATRPVLWPVIGPTGEPMTRAWPVGPTNLNEKHDHIHHRSVWISYEGVNDIDFWQQEEKGVERTFPAGIQKHREFKKIEANDDTAVIVTVNDWLGPDGTKICEDERTWTFGTDVDQRWLDCRFVLTASEGELRLADSKEGFFAVRVADSMNVDHKQGGRIVSSRGLTDAAAWAQPAEWVDYQGPVAGETVGLAIFTHPESLNYPAPWHVRTYGLFAGNPLGELAFTDGDSKVQERPLRMTLAKGESLVLHYRIVLHRGDEKQAQLAEKYAEYIAE
ncbi:DUF6807 domain-containing protein [Bythopirellula polymerisocia]|uniref:Methane oxygenase PmoA n=1 Tax=Bythopirellula polymerisocia TaxID=2528003 RepID=A0A5C6CMD4_9BACT|nr:PmoA family protein [Bythopirellula polymerisocia]TWU24727.1 hypothetical protein Pla144_36130 [Bythopirellula polymerisocia]